MTRSRGAWFVLALAAAAAAASSPPGSALVGATTREAADEPGAGAFQTSVSIDGTDFRLNGELTYPGTPIEGLLMNARMVQAVFDDENPQTVGNWAYPDTSRWDPDRNTDEFVAAVPSYAAHGLRAVTINLQGGRPRGDPVRDAQPWRVSAYTRDGRLKEAWLARLDRALRALDANGMVCILGLFYFAQDQRLEDEDAVVRAADAVVDWLLARGYTNVLIEINNEANVAYDHAILRPGRVDELIARVQQRSQGRLKVSTSFTGGALPAADVVAQSDYVLLHGNARTPSELEEKIKTVRGFAAYRAEPKPIVVNEDSPDLGKLEAAVRNGASWGYHERGVGNYRDGFQAPPVNWTINTPNKRAFFARVAELARVPDAEPDPEPEPDDGSQLLVSTSGSRADPRPLEGATVRGPVYVFLEPNAAQAGPEVSQVRFYLDDPARSGPPVRTERWKPYDFAGTASAVGPIPFDTSKVTDGTHTITAALEFSVGRTEVVTATFLVSNG